jgi:hypothetical protein
MTVIDGVVDITVVDGDVVDGDVVDDGVREGKEGKT